MTKQELEKAIENGESVWGVLNQYSYENDVVKEIDFTKIENIELHYNYFEYFDCKNLHAYYYKSTFKTKAEAEHYLHHANVTRTETLPFLTWEKFLSEESISFISVEGFRCCLYYNKVDDMIYLDKGYETDTYGATEENFYKAYDECVRLFKGE